MESSRFFQFQEVCLAFSQGLLYSQAFLPEFLVTKATAWVVSTFQFFVEWLCCSEFSSFPVDVGQQTDFLIVLLPSTFQSAFLSFTCCYNNEKIVPHIYSLWVYFSRLVCMCWCLWSLKDQRLFVLGKVWLHLPQQNSCMLLYGKQFIWRYTSPACHCAAHFVCSLLLLFIVWKVGIIDAVMFCIIPELRASRHDFEVGSITSTKGRIARLIVVLIITCTCVASGLTNTLLQDCCT